jgi:protease-4
MKNNLIFELLDSALAVRESSRHVIEMVAKRMLVDENFTLEQIPLHIKSSAGAIIPENRQDGNPFDALEKDNIVIIPLEGVMTKEPSWYRYGCNMIADYLELANASSSVSGVILLADTPGGTVNSVLILQDILTRFTKPVVTLVNGYLCSGGMWTAVFTDKIFALNEMNTIGSIGVMITLTDYSKMYESLGITSRSIYPPESKFKNLPYREAMKEKPDDTPIIEEMLTPLAIKFQETIKARRPRLDTSVEGILEGRDFFAGDAVKHGLIDGIANLEQVIDYIKKEKTRRETIYNNI